MKIAAYNVENLFVRAKIFNQEDNSLSSKIQKAVAELNTLFDRLAYSASDKAKMLTLIDELDLKKSDTGDYVILRQIREKVIKRPNSGPNQIIANGRADWIGWVELKTEAVNEIAMMNTGRVLRDVNADIMAVVEAENRISLKKFSESVIVTVNAEIPNPTTPYSEIMVIDGNDERGIDVGLMTKNGYSIGFMKSHISDIDPLTGNIIYSRDCPEYQVITPLGNEIWVLPNHFKSKFGGNNPQSIAKRRSQSKRTAQIYNDLLAAGKQNVIVLGDLNDTPDNTGPLADLLNTSLKDVSTHPTFDPGEFPQIGTYGLGNNGNKIDYLLLSPNLFSKVQASGLFRKGAYPGASPRWTVYPTLTKKVHAGSDHHVIWAEINI